MKRAPRALIVTTLLVLACLIFSVAALARPQCPDNYTQAQIEASNCVVGSNIGAGILLLWVGPLFLGLIGVWAVVLFRKDKS